MNYKVNIQLLNYFIETNKLASYRVLCYIRSKFNNHFHYSDIPTLLSDLKISKQALFSAFRHLSSINAMERRSKSYFRFRSWKKWFSDIGWDGKNRIVDTGLENIRTLSKLRTLYYTLLYRSSWRMAKKNYNEENPNLKKLHKTRGFYEVSSTFVKQTTFTKFSLVTLLKHLNRSEQYGWSEIRKSVTKVFKTEHHSEMLNFLQGIDDDQKRYFKVAFQAGYFIIYFHNSNFVRFNL